MVTLILGGAKSGKSSFALNYASKQTGNKAYVATGIAFDEEMQKRIDRHRKERSSQWNTFEEPLALPSLLEELGKDYEVILVDCLTLWLNNLLLQGRDTEKETASFLAAISGLGGFFYAVANEVGLGIVPDNALARQFRDLAGNLNQAVAAQADEVYLITAGIPLKLK